MKKSLKIFGGAIAALLVMLMCTSVVLNVVTLNKVNAIEAKSDDAVAEDGVVIAEEYEIKSTKQISEAYISGDSSALSDSDRETLKLASNVLKKVIKNGMSDYEKELAVYSWIYKNVKHDEGMMTVVRTTDGSDAPQGVLKNKTAVCVGYATTFRMFMQMLGIDCMVVHSKDLGHSWDLVKIGDSWYHTDLYFDTPNNKFAHFNMTDSMRQDDYEWNTSFFPRANGYEYCYAVRNAKSAKDVYELPKLLRKSLDERKSLLSLKFKDISDKNKKILESIMDELQNTVTTYKEFEECYVDWHTLKDGSDYIFYITIDNSSTDSTVTVDEKAQKRITKAIDKAFSDLTPSDSGSDDDIDYDATGVKTLRGENGMRVVVNPDGTNEVIQD